MTFSLFVLIYQADSFKMGQELVQNVDSLEHLLGLSRDERVSASQNSKAEGEAKTNQGLLIGKSPEGGRTGNRVQQTELFVSSSVNSSGTNLDGLPR